MKKQEYVDSVKDELIKLLEQENTDYYEKCLSKADIEGFVKDICSKLNEFDGDKWELATLVAGTVYEICAPNLPGSSLVSYIVLKIFRQGIATVCNEYAG